MSASLGFHFVRLVDGKPVLLDGRPVPPVGEWLVEDGPIKCCPDPARGGDHHWHQVKMDIWCSVCGADYDDENRTHVMFAGGAQ